MVSQKSHQDVSQYPAGIPIQRITDLCQKLNTGHDVPELLLLVAKEGVRLLEAERVTLFLFDQERCELWSPITLDGESIRFDARLGIAGASVLTGKLINVSNAQEDERFYQGVDARTKYKTRSVLAIPLRDSLGDVMGTLQALNKKGGSFRKTDEEVAELIAGQVAIAIENTTTVKHLKERQQKLHLENAQLWKEIEGKFSTKNIIGTSERVQSIIRLIEQIKDSAINILITGESGTGKELIAKALHFNSPRARKPFVALNCAALPETLLESELFGIERKVATDVEPRIGKFEEAHEGTLFLDEIGDLSLSAQAKMLRVLQERIVVRVGGQVTRPIDVRVIAATNVDLENGIKKGTFRSDLYYRLRVLPIHTAPLREVPEDIVLLAEFFLRKICAEMGRGSMRFSADAKRSLTHYSWPGNVRELENEIKRIAVTVRRSVIGDSDFSSHIQVPSTDGAVSGAKPGMTLKQAVETLEVREIKNALRQCQGNRVQTAKVLGLSRQGLIKKIARYKIL